MIGPKAQSLPGDEGSVSGVMVMVVILGDGSRNSIGGTVFHRFGDVRDNITQKGVGIRLPFKYVSANTYPNYQVKYYLF